MELVDIETFLILADELHFGRTAERAYVSPARVSQRVKALEREIGGALFARTSRRVRLTPLGAHLRDALRPANTALRAAVDEARTLARAPSGPLRIGFTSTTAGPDLDRIIAVMERTHRCEITPRELPIFDPLTRLRDGRVDVLVNWLVVDAPDLTRGPVIGEYARVLMVSADHPLAADEAVSAEVLADHPVTNWDWYAAPDLRDLRRAMVPPRTPSGRTVRVHPTPVRTLSEGVSQIARGLTVHPTVTSVADRLRRDDIALVPITDLPPIPLGLLWCTAHENARIRALAEVARAVERASADRL